MDLQDEVRGAGITIRIGDGVGEVLRAIATAMQVFEVGIGWVQRVGVSSVGVQFQSAVSAGESAGGDWTSGHAVGTLHVVGQNVAGQREVGFRGGAGVAVVQRFGQVVDHVHIKGRIGSRAVVVDHGDGELLRQ
ncbi:hypothetical protein PseAD21_01155 [Pseudomonas sp. AD21]|nr:hypothetical protein PseAD21_01155 [Pseudomonas sp. AD21]